MSRQYAQPFIWDARILTSSSSDRSRPLVSTVCENFSMACTAALFMCFAMSNLGVMTFLLFHGRLNLSAVASAQAEGLRLPLMGSLSRRRLGEGGRASAHLLGRRGGPCVCDRQLVRIDHRVDVSNTTAIQIDRHRCRQA